MVWKFCEILKSYGFQKGQIMWDFISQCGVWHVCCIRSFEWKGLLSQMNRAHLQYQVLVLYCLNICCLLFLVSLVSDPT